MTVEADLARVTAALGGARFPPSEAPAYQFRVSGAGDPSIWTWTRALGMVAGAPVAPTCVVEAEAGALPAFLGGRTGGFRIGGLMADVARLRLAFGDPQLMALLVAWALSSEDKLALIVKCERALLEIAGERPAFQRISGMLDAWRGHSIAACVVDQELISDVPELEMVPWVPAASLGIDGLLAQDFPGLRHEAAKFLSGEVKAPAYGSRTEAPRGKNPAGWRHWNLIEAFRWVPSRCERFPHARAVLEHIGREMTIIHAGFLVLEAGNVIGDHSDGLGWALSYSYGLIVPEGCHLAVAGESRPHREGGSLMFNDSFVHGAGNAGTTTRVLFSVVCVNPAFTRVEAACLRRAATLLPDGELFYPT